MNQEIKTERLHPYWFTNVARSITDLFQGILSSLIWWFFIVFAQIIVEGRENIRDAESFKKNGGKVILASNHMGDIDVFLLRGMLRPFGSPLTPLRTVSLPQKYYNNFGVIRRFLYTELVFKILGAYPAYVGHKDYASALYSHVTFLANAETVCIFPEGKSTKNGRINESHGGLGYLARESGASILPVTIVGAWKVKPFAFFLRRYQFVVHVEPLVHADIVSRYPRSVDGYKEIVSLVMSKIATRFDEIRKNYPRATQVLYENVSAEYFGGEYRKKGILLILLTYIVGYWCMVSNISKITYFRLFYRKQKSFNEVLWELGRSVHHGSSIFFDVLSSWNHNIKINAASWKSLEPFYDYHTKTVREHHEAVAGSSDEKILKKLRIHTSVFFSRLWMGNAHNRQALRNRLLLSTKYLKMIIETYPENQTITILSIASGSARAIIEAVKDYPTRNFQITLIDLDANALEYAKSMATSHGIQRYFTYVNDSSSYINTLIQNKMNFNIVEMVGFLDYRKREGAISLIHRIRQVLAKDGSFLCANIQPNNERVLLEWGLLWPMIYRTDREYYQVLREAGFADNEITLFHEPFRIHILSIAKNSN